MTAFHLGEPLSYYLGAAIYTRECVGDKMPKSDGNHLREERCGSRFLCSIITSTGLSFFTVPLLVGRSRIKWKYLIVPQINVEKTDSKQYGFHGTVLCVLVDFQLSGIGHRLLDSRSKRVKGRGDDVFRWHLEPYII